MGVNPVPVTDSTTSAPLAPRLDELENLRVLLPELVKVKRWAPWVGSPKIGKGGVPELTKAGYSKISKQPINPRTGKPMQGWNDPANLLNFEVALDWVQRQVKEAHRGLELALVKGDGLACVDIDGGIDADGALTPLAVRVLDMFPGCYTEISQSGEGLHIFLRGMKPGGAWTRNRELDLEIYDSGRLIAITGAQWGDGQLREAQAELDTFLTEFKPVKERKTEQHKEKTAPAALLDDDAELLGRIRSSKQGARFDALWDGGGEDASGGDLALCGMLAFWTGKDAATMDRLFRQSGRIRDKWDVVHSSDGQTYREMTIALAIDGCTEVYGSRQGTRAAKRVNTRGGAGTGAEAREERAAPERVTIPAAERSPDPDTERANAERLAEHHGHELRYVKGLGWLVYDGRRWAADEEAAKRLTSRVTRYIDEEAAELGRLAAQEPTEQAAKPHLEAAKRLRKWRRQCGQYRTVAGTLGLADSILGLEAEKLDTQHHLLNVLNGTLDLNTGEMKEHYSGDLITQVAPVVYDATAQCPIWERVVSEVMPDPDKRAFLQKWMGYCLSGYTDEACMVFAYGSGSNGKTTVFEEVLLRLLGNGYGRVAAPNLLMASKSERHTTEKASLRGSRFVISSEPDAGQLFSSQGLKLMIGVKEMTARFMRQDDVTFPVRFKITLMSNHLPNVTDSSEGFWRRIRLLTFEQSFPVDGSVGDALEGELSGILRWCLEGYRRWQCEGLGEPLTVKEAKEEYRRERDTVALFAGEMLVNTEESASPGYMFSRYREWCQDEGYEAIKHPGDFNKELMRLGYVYSRSGGVRRWVGVYVR